MAMSKKQLFDHDFEGYAQSAAQKPSENRESAIKGFCQKLHAELVEAFKQRVGEIVYEIEEEEMESELEQRRRLKIQHELDNPEL